MSDRFSRVVYNRFLKAHAGVKLTDEQHMDDFFGRNVDKIDFEKFDPVDTMNSLDRKIERWSKTKLKVGIWLIVPILLLAFSILGVRFEISIVGIKLESIGKLKEIIIVLTFSAGFIYSMFDLGVDDLKRLKSAIFARHFGEDQLEVMKDTFEYEMPARQIGHFLSSDKFEVTGIKKFIEISIGIMFIFYMIVLLLTAVAITYVVLQDLWIHPNINPTAAKTLVVVAAVLSSIEILAAFGKRIFPFTYIEFEKAKATSGIDEPSGTLSKELHEFVDDEIRRRENRRNLFHLAIGLALISFIVADYIGVF